MPKSLTYCCAGLAAYVYAGYPVLVALIARSRPVEGPYGDYTPRVTLIISALDERAAIVAKIANIAALDYPQELLHVVVVSEGSRDGTEEAARAAAPQATVLHNPQRRGKSAAMALGVASARSEILVFSDANNLYASDALREVLKPLADPRVGAVTGAKVIAGGPDEVFGGELAYWRYESFIKRQESRLGCCTGVIGEFLAVRRGLVPTFPPGLVNDDFFVAMHVARLGYRVAYAHAAKSYEPTAASLEAETVRRRRMTAGRWQSLMLWRRILPVRRPLVLWQVLSHKYLRLLLPIAMAGALAGNLVDVLAARQRANRSRVDVEALACQVTFYALAALGGTAPKKLVPVRTAAMGARYLVRSNYASLEGLWAYLTSRQQMHMWQRVTRHDDGNAVSPSIS